MAWPHENPMRIDRFSLFLIALLLVGGVISAIVFGRDTQHQVVLGGSTFAFACLFFVCTLRGQGFSLSVDSDRLRWCYHTGIRVVRGDLPLTKLSELRLTLHRPLWSLQGQPREVSVWTTDAENHVLPPDVAAYWPRLFHELREIKPDLKFVEQVIDVDEQDSI